MGHSQYRRPQALRLLPPPEADTLQVLAPLLYSKQSHSVHIMRKIPYSFYIAKMKRISTLREAAI